MTEAADPRSSRAGDALTGQHHPAACDGALTRAFGFLGKRWNGVILATLQHGPLGYAELRRAVEGISDSVLSERLSELSGAGLTVREVEPGPPVMVRYRLTQDGTALMPILGELAGWASRHLPEAPAVPQRRARTRPSRLT
ncbi:helix-turn-helix domain-containing protein [Streptomyces sp. RP5T]|uniref:winged helix-turn-helix transcriptional regulator n=1 Tax=Streptomyces sp. RP5T TaxID=2490848 RepID=UPI000F646739|nr:helix-turn-helix domain-containing protein [Streptomyces sp. RP5T]RRR87116.1 transcriptional regulator [Streptomyces sp. RP5T]